MPPPKKLAERFRFLKDEQVVYTPGLAGSCGSLPTKDAPSMEYLPTFTLNWLENVGILNIPIQMESIL